MTAVTVTYLISEHDDKIEHKEKRKLCEALLPMPDFDNKTSTDLEYLKNFLPNVFRFGYTV